jgi:K+-sensing histidine kinase KdpD
LNALTLGRLLATVATLALATVVTVLLTDALGLPHISMIYLISVIFVATRFGSHYGFLAALLAISLFDFFVEQPRFTFGLGTKQDLVNIIVFIAAAILAGVYADRLRQQQAVTRLLLEATKGFPDAAMYPFARRLLQSVAPRDEPKRMTRSLASESRRVLVGLAIVAACAAATYVLHTYLDAPRTSALFIAAVVASALLVGARAGLVAAVVAVTAFNFIFEEPAFTLSLGSSEDFINLVLFCSVAWFVGGFADRVRAEREMSRTTLSASEAFSVSADEAALRSNLREAICQLSGTQSVWVTDETGALVDAERADPMPAGLAAVYADMAGGQRTHAFQVWRIRALETGGRSFGVVVWFALAVAPKQAAQTEYAISVLIDLATAAIARKRIDGERADVERVAQTERMRSALLSSMSHDFRTPLAGILGSATSLLDLNDRYDEQKRTDLLRNIRDQAFRLNRYVENLLSLTRLDAGALNVQARPQLLEPLIYDVWESLGDAGGARRILETKIEADAAVMVDAVLLHQALANVFENAIKFSKEGASVLVRTRRVGDEQVLDVLDEGPGVHPDEMAKIFDRFYRAKAAPAPGIGLGLHITKCAVEAMHGRIQARSRDDGRAGLVVSMSLRAAEATP